MLIFAGAWGGAVLAGVLAIAYDTSANVATLEGGHRHLTFQGCLLLMALGAAAGAFIGLLARGAQRRGRQDPDVR